MGLTAEVDPQGDDHVWNTTRESFDKQGFWGRPYQVRIQGKLTWASFLQLLNLADRSLCS
jgi:hypothetical protein